MQFKEPIVGVKDFGGTRLATVQIPVEGGLMQFISATFEDPQRPNESNQAERARLIARAKQVLSAAATSL